MTIYSVYDTKVGNKDMIMQEAGYNFSARLSTFLRRAVNCAVHGANYAVRGVV